MHDRAYFALSPITFLPGAVTSISVRRYCVPTINAQLNEGQTEAEQVLTKRHPKLLVRPCAGRQPRSFNRYCWPLQRRGPFKEQLFVGNNPNKMVVGIVETRLLGQAILVDELDAFL